MESLVVGVYNLALVAGTGYVVFGLGHSGWWFVAAAVFLMRSTEKEQSK